jgi:hypothetical protein
MCNFDNNVACLSFYWIESYCRHNTKPNNPQNYWPYVRRAPILMGLLKLLTYLLVMNCLEIIDNLFITRIRHIYIYDLWNKFHLNNPNFAITCFDTKKGGEPKLYFHKYSMLYYKREETKSRFDIFSTPCFLTLATWFLLEEKC